MLDDSISRLFIMLVHLRQIPVTNTLGSIVSNLCIKGKEEPYHT